MEEAGSPLLAERERRGARDTGASPVDAVRMRGISKALPRSGGERGRRLRGRPGEVHALLGENGAGKTTLMNILTGLYRPDEGEIELFGRPVHFTSPRGAIEAGIGMVHQHFRLVDRLTVAENVILGWHRPRFWLSERAEVRRLREISEALGMPVPLQAPVWQLSVGEQQRVEIVKAVFRGSRVLILDEPTAVLTPQEAEQLFATLRTMAREGHTVIVITHKLNEVKAVADRVTVLRRGRYVATVSGAEATQRSLAALMVGREIDEARRVPRAAAWRGRRAARRRLTRGRGRTVADRRSGRSPSRSARRDRRRCRRRRERPARARRGALRICGRLGRLDPRRRQRELRPVIRLPAISAGIAHVPEDRLGTGLAPSLSVAGNVVLKSYRGAPVSRGPLLAAGPHA